RALNKDFKRVPGYGPAAFRRYCLGYDAAEQEGIIMPNNISRRQFMRLAAGVAALPFVSRVASGQAYPTRPVMMIVPYPPGGTADVIGRLLSERMRASLGQPIILESVAGANGSIGVGRASRAAPDGYTVVIGLKDTHVLNGAALALSYDVVKDFEPI